MKTVKSHWRFYETANGRCPVKEFLGKVLPRDKASVMSAMYEARKHGTRVARHLVEDLYELRVDGEKAHYRLIFAQEAKFVLLAIDIYDKDTQRIPTHVRARAVDRLRDWRTRGEATR